MEFHPIPNRSRSRPRSLAQYSPPPRSPPCRPIRPRLSFASRSEKAGALPDSRTRVARKVELRTAGSAGEGSGRPAWWRPGRRTASKPPSSASHTAQSTAEGSGRPARREPGQRTASESPTCYNTYEDSAARALAYQSSQIPRERGSLMKPIKPTSDSKSKYEQQQALRKLSVSRGGWRLHLLLPLSLLVSLALFLGLPIIALTLVDDPATVEGLRTWIRWAGLPASVS